MEKEIYIKDSIMRFCEYCGRPTIIEKKPTGQFNPKTGERLYHIVSYCPRQFNFIDFIITSFHSYRTYRLNGEEKQPGEFFRPSPLNL